MKDAERRFVRWSVALFTALLVAGYIVVYLIALALTA